MGPTCLKLPTLRLSSVLHKLQFDELKGDQGDPSDSRLSHHIYHDTQTHPTEHKRASLLIQTPAGRPLCCGTIWTTTWMGYCAKYQSADVS